MAVALTGSNDWEAISKQMRVIRLTVPLRVLVPALAFPSFSKRTRGLTLYPGRGGTVLGAMLVASSVLVGGMLLYPAGVAGPILSAWVIGTAGVTMLWSSLRPTAFVKPICVECRLMPIIREHEAIHLAGTASENAVWESMRTRHSSASLSLEGDPAICPFCPIPRRLSGQ